MAAAHFGPCAVAEAVACGGGRPVGFALWYPTYSTIVDWPGLHLEDLYVSGEHRGSGVGLALMEHLAGVARERGFTRLE